MVNGYGSGWMTGVRLNPVLISMRTGHFEAILCENREKSLSNILILFLSYSYFQAILSLGILTNGILIKSVCFIFSCALHRPKAKFSMLSHLSSPAHIVRPPSRNYDYDF